MRIDRNVLITAVAAAVIGAGAGAAGTPPRINTVTVTLPAPSPQVITNRVEVPGPTLYIMPPECLDYVVALEKIDGLRVDAYNELLHTGSADVDAINTLSVHVDELAVACVAVLAKSPTAEGAS